MERAPVAQLVEQEFCKLQVVGSNPAGGIFRRYDRNMKRKR